MGSLIELTSIDQLERSALGAENDKTLESRLLQNGEVSMGRRYNQIADNLMRMDWVV